MYLFMAEPHLKVTDGLDGSGLQLLAGLASDSEKKDSQSVPHEGLHWKPMMLYRDLPLVLGNIDTTRYSFGVQPLHEVTTHPSNTPSPPT